MGPYSEQADKLVQEDDYGQPQFGRDTGYYGARPSVR
jgi:hypothetical protein